MPLYEYECQACGHRFEVIQRFSDAPIDACRQCGGPVRKLLSPPAIQFKGTGWYVTDYARKGASEAAASGKEAAGGGASASSAASTEKPASSAAEGAASASAPATSSSSSS